MSELLLKNCLRVGKVDESSLVGSNLHIGTFLQVHVTQNNLTALFNAQVVHHPDGDMAHALLSGELEHAAIGLQTHLRVRDHERHGVLDAQASKLVKRRGRQNDYERENKQRGE